jgi:hypothetical protein
MSPKSHYNLLQLFGGGGLGAKRLIKSLDCYNSHLEKNKLEKNQMP